MKISAQVRLAPGNSVAERIACLAETGFEAVEVHSDAVDHVSEYRRALAAAGIPALSMCPAGRSLDLVADEYSQRRRIDQVRRAIDACNELGITALISVPVRGALPPDIVAADEADSYVRALEQLAPHAEAAGVTITVEPLNRYEMHLVNTLADGIAIAARVGSPRVKILADVFHMNIEEDNTPASIRAAADWIGHVHLADNQRAHPGTGATDFSAVFNALRDIGYAGSAALECRMRGDPAEALRQCATYLRAARG
ncbi:MAG: sugar phosphate isomerase/epimerase [Chloroflexota bacterium]|nr:sugar phosphate isomerase/epimerase [Chloroflexota bacterium]